MREFFDSSKASVADVRHRAMLHSAWGIYLASRVFGEYLTNSEGKKVSTRDLGEHHVIQDLGFIPGWCVEGADVDSGASGGCRTNRA